MPFPRSRLPASVELINKASMCVEQGIAVVPGPLKAAGSVQMLSLSKRSSSSNQVTSHGLQRSQSSQSLVEHLSCISMQTTADLILQIYLSCVVCISNQAMVTAEGKDPMAKNAHLFAHL